VVGRRLELVGVGPAAEALRAGAPVGRGNVIGGELLAVVPLEPLLQLALVVLAVLGRGLHEPVLPFALGPAVHAEGRDEEVLQIAALHDVAAREPVVVTLRGCIPRPSGMELAALLRRAAGDGGRTGGTRRG